MEISREERSECVGRKEKRKERRDGTNEGRKERNKGVERFGKEKTNYLGKGKSDQIRGSKREGTIG